MRAILLAMLLLVGGCAKQNGNASGARENGPNVGPSAAPGVAFNYAYAFQLPSARIAAVQEQHAQACEKLGLGRCRITGMRYRLVDGHNVEAMLAFRLDPAIARQFGRQGIDSVAKSEGLLVDSEISGEDAGAAIAAADRTEEGLRGNLNSVETQLRRSGLKADERSDLETRVAELRESLQSNSVTREASRQSLATTPVTFTYGSGDLVPGFESPLRDALRRSGESFISGLAVLIEVVVTLAPWMLALLFAAWLWRRFKRRFLSLDGDEHTYGDEQT